AAPATTATHRRSTRSAAARRRYATARGMPSCVPFRLCRPPRSGLDMEHADERKEPPGGGEVGFRLARDRFEQLPRGASADRAAGLVGRFDLAGRSLARCLVVRFADREGFAHPAAETREAEPDRAAIAAVSVAQGDGEPAVADRELQRPRAGMAA